MIHTDYLAMIRSGALAAAVVVLLLLALMWQPQGVSGGGGSPPTEPAESSPQEPATVQITVPPADDSQPPSGEQTSLGSREEGTRDSDAAGEDVAATGDSPAPQPQPVSPPAEPATENQPESPADQSSVALTDPEETSAEVPADVTPASEPAEPAPTETTDAESSKPVPDNETASVPAEPTTADAVAPTDADDASKPAQDTSGAVRAAADGALPRLRHTGEIELVRSTWPRLEVAWVTQLPLRPDEASRTLVEAVLDPSGRVRWQNLQTGTQSSGFSFTTMRYNLRGRVRVADPTKLQLWKHRDRIAAIANVSADQSKRFQWGYYRHRSEVFELARAESAYRTAEAGGRLTFDPAAGDVLEVTWGVSPQKNPTIVSARFVPAAGEAVSLKLP